MAKEFKKTEESKGDDHGGWAIIIVWGGLAIIIFGGLWGSGLLSQISLININTDISANQKCPVENANCNIMGYVYKGEEIKNSIFHYQKNVDIYQIIQSPANQFLFYAATNQGVFFSQDSGKNWYPFSDLNKNIDQNTKIYQIVEKPGSSEEMFIAVYKNNKGIIYQSSDGLVTLNKLLEFNREAPYSLEIFNGNLYIGFNTGKILVYSFINKNIKQVAKLSSSISSLININDYVLLAQSSSKIFQSFNGTDFVQKENLTNIKDIAVSQDDLAIYLTARNGFLKSFDYGNNYEKISSLPIETKKIEKFAASSAYHIYVFGNHQLFESVDAGQTWKSYNNKMDRTISAIGIASDKLLVGTKSFNLLNILFGNLF